MNFFFFLMFSGPETPKSGIGNRFIRIFKKQFVSLTTQPSLQIQYGSKYSTHLLSFLPSRSDNTIDPLHPISPRSNTTPSFVSLLPNLIPSHSLVSHLLSSAPRLYHFSLSVSLLVQQMALPSLAGRETRDRRNAHSRRFLLAWTTEIERKTFRWLPTTISSFNVVPCLLI